MSFPAEEPVSIFSVSDSKSTRRDRSFLSNCTSNVRLHIKHIGSARPWDWQLLVNGSIDEHAYELGAIDTSLPFAELKRLSHINDRARAADHDPAFSSRIRDGLPGMPRQGLDPS